MAGTQAKASPCPPAFLESPDPPVRPPTSSPNPENGVWGPGSCKPSHILIQPHLELGGLGEGEVGGGAPVGSRPRGVLTEALASSCLPSSQSDARPPTPWPACGRDPVSGRSRGGRVESSAPGKRGSQPFPPNLGDLHLGGSTLG